MCAELVKSSLPVLLAGLCPSAVVEHPPFADLKVGDLTREQDRTGRPVGWT